MNDREPDLAREGVGYVVVAAERAGLLEALGQEPASAEGLAERCHLDPRAAGLVLDALASLGICRRVASGFCRVPSPAAGWPWTELSRFLETGEVVAPIDDRNRRGEAYAQVVDHLATRFGAAARRLADLLPPADHVLDVGCGSGVWSLEMIRDRPTAHAVGLDLAPVAPRFLARAAALGLEERARALVGDYFSDPADLGGIAFDRVVLANVLHLESTDDAARVVGRFAKYLRPGGEIVVVDCFPGDAADDRVAAAFYSLHLGMRTGKGRVHPRADVERWLAESGLGAPRLVPILPGLAGLVATRP